MEQESRLLLKSFLRHSEHDRGELIISLSPVLLVFPHVAGSQKAGLCSLLLSSLLGPVYRDMDAVTDPDTWTSFQASMCPSRSCCMQDKA